jgi:hypothetical protein
MSVKRGKPRIFSSVPALILVAFFFSACQGGISPNSTPTTNQNLVGTIVAATLTAFPTPTPQPSLIPTSPSIYSNEVYGFAFEYSPGWQVTETYVPVGSKLSQRSLNRVDINAFEREVLVVDLAKGSEWILEFVATKSPPGSCPGGEGPDPAPSNYLPLAVLGRKAARLRVEDGYIWTIPGSNDMNILPVVFYKQPGECEASWPDSSINPGEVVSLWGYSDPQMPLMVNMTYYSNQFTAGNLQNRTIDYAVIHEMDQIVQSLRLLANK